jgi:hypothetical protein
MLVEPVAGFLKQYPFSTAMGAILIAGVAGLWTASTYQSPQKATVSLSAQPMCAAWDQEASGGIAQLLLDTSAKSEWKLDQALLQSRRARKHCRSGAMQVAYHDYASLHRGFPLVTGSVSASRAHDGLPRPSTLTGEVK